MIFHCCDKLYLYWENKISCCFLIVLTIVGFATLCGLVFVSFWFIYFPKLAVIPTLQEKRIFCGCSVVYILLSGVTSWLTCSSNMKKLTETEKCNENLREANEYIQEIRKHPRQKVKNEDFDFGQELKRDHALFWGISRASRLHAFNLIVWKMNSDFIALPLATVCLFRRISPKRLMGPM